MKSEVKVSYKVTGGELSMASAKTLGDLKAKLGLNGYTGSIDGEPADDDQELSEGNFVTFSQALKGGC